MAQEQIAFGKALEQVVEAVMFENWMRFYFISEKLEAPKQENGESPLFMAIPEQGMARIQELYPHLYPMAVGINGKELDFSTSQQCICSFVAEHLEGKTMSSDLANMVLNSSTLNTELQLFNTWVQAHESQLDEGFSEFGMWKNLYAQWRGSDQVKQWVTELKNAALNAAANPAQGTVQ
jgi:hypothetical protein